MRTAPKTRQTFSAKFRIILNQPLKAHAETVNVKTGFIARIVAFWRALFRSLPKRAQLVPEAAPAVFLLDR